MKITGTFLVVPFTRLNLQVLKKVIRQLMVPPDRRFERADNETLD